MVYLFLWRKIGTCVSCFLIATSCLLPQLILAQDSMTTVEQINSEFTQLLTKELERWRQQAALSQLDAKVEIKVPSGAKRLALCPVAVSIDVGSGIPLGNVQRKVSCEPLGWSLFVRAKVSVSVKIPVANRVLKRGEHILAADIDWKVIKLGASDRDLVTALDEIVGRQVVRKVRRYQPIRAVQLSSPQWVNIGDRVIIEARSNGFYANMPGKALEGGGEGKGIRVRNLSSGKVIIAYPIAKGRVATQF